MKNTFGQNLTLTLFGESHGLFIGAVLDGLTPGMPVDPACIEKALSKRRPQSGTDTARREADRFEIVSGVFQGHTTGTPLCILIPNENANSKDYVYGEARPGHADYAAFCKYHGFEDYRGGGHFSGRLTAALVAAGGILTPALERKGIRIGTHIRSCGGINDDGFSGKTEELTALNERFFPVLNAESGEKMTAEIMKAASEKESIGGITETEILGLPAGLGEPWFDSTESLLSHVLFSIGGIKGVEFGDGFSMTNMKASDANDSFSVENGRIVTETNHNGGLNGGITNGMPVIFRCAVKPTPSIGKEQKSVDFVRNENISLKISGRHDPAIIRRICPVIDSVTALVIADLLTGRFGTNYFSEGYESCNTD